MVDYVLFGTEGCHLCEEAEELVTAASLRYQIHDVMDSEAWQAQYGLLIPVLRQLATGRQLNWPFDAETLADFIHDVKG